MVKFEKYPHVNDLIDHYTTMFESEDVSNIVANGITSQADAELFSRFIWKMVEAINDDEENEVTVLGSPDNTEMLPDISYEITKLIKSNGFYSIWEKVSKDEME